jgi:hypothetical protein
MPVNNTCRFVMGHDRRPMSARDSNVSCSQNDTREGTALARNYSRFGATACQTGASWRITPPLLRNALTPQMLSPFWCLVRKVGNDCVVFLAHPLDLPPLVLTYSRRLAFKCQRNRDKWPSVDVIGSLTELFAIGGVPKHILRDNSLEFVARNLKRWIDNVGLEVHHVEPHCHLGWRKACGPIQKVLHANAFHQL